MGNILKVLNCYAGIGGNRKLWQDVEVTAVEYNEEIAGIYKDHFPNDTVIVGDAHQYLLEHYKEFDFIWSSPPCQSHSRTNYFLNPKGVIRYPDLKLYEEIILLQSFFKGQYCVENVIGYYEPLIKPQEIARHYMWANFEIKPKAFDTHIGRMCGSKSDLGITQATLRRQRQADLGFDLSRYKICIVKKEQALNNCVTPDLGLYIMEQAKGIMRIENTNQLKLSI